jgi:hypothetical protein
VENMSELQVKVLEVSPAIVKFNFEEMLQVAKQIASEYEGRVFTDETVKEGKKTVAELRKIKKSINDFKVKTKKELTESVATFEEQCKVIMAEFDKPLEFIENQCELFEQKRIEEKTNWVKSVIIENFEILGIESKWQSIEIKKEWLNATTTQKDIRNEVAYQTQLLHQQQQVYYQNVELVRMAVEVANVGLDVKLNADNFIYQIDRSSLEEIKYQITLQANRQLQAQEEFKKKVEQEANAKALEQVAEVIQEAAKFIPVEATEEEPTREIRVSIKGTESQISALREYLKSGGYKVKLI